jgi:uncharacterized protein
MTESRTPPGSNDGWWLLKNGEVLASADVARTFAQRTRGLLGRDRYDGAYVLHHTSAVHSLGMRFAIDVAFLDKRLVVVDMTELRPWRMTLPRIRSRSVLEASAGSFDRWGLRVGDELELRCGK